MPRSYNYIYKELVEGQNDIVGHIAYSLYKADKIKFIEKFKADHRGIDPTEADLKPFHDASCLEGALERYKLTAMSILQQFLDYSLEESTKQIEENCVNNHKQMLTEVVSGLKPMGGGKQFLFGMSQSIVGAFAFAIILAAIGFINLFKVNDVNVTFQQNKQQVENQQYSLPPDTIPSQKK